MRKLTGMAVQSTSHIAPIWLTVHLALSMGPRGVRDSANPKSTLAVNQLPTVVIYLAAISCYAVALILTLKTLQYKNKYVRRREATAWLGEKDEPKFR